LASSTNSRHKYRELTDSPNQIKKNRVVNDCYRLLTFSKAISKKEISKIMNY